MPEANVTNQRLKIGLVGLGHRGARTFARLVADHPDALLTAAADTNARRLALAVEATGATGYGSAVEMARSAPLDAVIVTTPDHTHADVVCSVIDSGVRRILVDKPIATTVADGLRIEQAARHAGADVSVGFNLRYLPLLARIKAVIAAGEIGDVMLMENREFYDGGRTYMARWNRKQALSGGLWVHKGTHDFDIFNWWNPGGTPVRVTASGSTSAYTADKIPFDVRPGVPVGPRCSHCAYDAICPDRSPGRAPLFDDEALALDDCAADLCVYTSDKDVHDNGIALVEYDNGVRASHLECFVCNFTDRLYTVVGDRGVLTASLSEPDRILLRPRWGADRTIDVPPAPEGAHGGADSLLVAGFIAAALGAPAPAATTRDGLLALAVGQAAELSMRHGGSAAVPPLPAPPAVGAAGVVG